MNGEMNNGGNNNLTNNVNINPNTKVSNDVSIENIPNPIEIPEEPQNISIEKNNIQPVQPSISETPAVMEIPNPEISTPVEISSLSQISSPLETSTAVINEVVNDISASENNINSTLDSTPQQEMVSQQVEMQSQNNLEHKKKSKLPLIILSILLIVSVCFVLVLYFIQTQKTSQNIYKESINNLTSKLIKSVDLIDTESKSMYSNNLSVSLNINSLGENNKELVDTLNKLKLNSEVQTDIKNGKAYFSFDTLYDSGSMLKAELLLKDKSLYLNVPELYDKVIKLSDIEQTEVINKSINLDDYKTIIQEFSNILKSSLKDEWFSKTKETISVLGSNVSTYKHTLTLNNERLKELSDSVYDGIINNDKMLTAIANINGLSKEDMKEKLSSKKENVKYDECNLEISIYLNKSDELQQIIIKNTSDGKDKTIELSMSDIDTFDILVDKEKLGTLILKDNDSELILKSEESVISFIFKNNDKNVDFTLKMEMNGMNMEASVVTDFEKEDIKILIYNEEIGMDFSIDVQMIEKEITEVKEIDVSNFVNAEEITEKDLENIMNKIQNNSNLLKLLEDIENSGLANMFVSEM